MMGGAYIYVLCCVAGGGTHIVTVHPSHHTTYRVYPPPPPIPYPRTRYAAFILYAFFRTSLFSVLFAYIARTWKSHYNIQCSEICTLRNKKFHTET